jgi:hypothetical protein
MLKECTEAGIESEFGVHAAAGLRSPMTFRASH